MERLAGGFGEQDLRWAWASIECELREREATGGGPPAFPEGAPVAPPAGRLPSRCGSGGKEEREVCRPGCPLLLSTALGAKDPSVEPFLLTECPRCAAGISLVATASRSPGCAVLSARRAAVAERDMSTKPPSTSSGTHASSGGSPGHLGHGEAEAPRDGLLRSSVDPRAVALGPLLCARERRRPIRAPPLVAPKSMRKSSWGSSSTPKLRRMYACAASSCSLRRWMRRSLGSRLTVGWFLMEEACAAYCKVLKFSSLYRSDGDKQASISMKPLPPMECCNNDVSLDSR
mmetsp:Transcript_53141/g.116283  ORF Transcript_53141/g.116283 Transcript_53141/m.116283 type:complete len:289 (+) Transcript_53141:359-1225(+)